jgi:hypothetical protein
MVKATAAMFLLLFTAEGMPLTSVDDLPAAIKLRSRFSSSGVQRTLGITQSSFCFQPQLYSLRIKSAATLGNLSQWKPLSMLALRRNATSHRRNQRLPTFDSRSLVTSRSYPNLRVLRNGADCGFPPAL